MRILLIEDDTRLSDGVARELRARNFAVDACTEAEEGLFMLTEYPVDLAIVDIGLPDFSGLDLIRRARDQGVQCPVLILTARGQWQEKVEGFEAGADDYLTKPFHTEELVARIQALLRRTAGHATPEQAFGPLRINLNSQTVTLDGEPLQLTAFEYRMLEYFVLHPDTVVTKTELLEHLYDEDTDPDSNVLEVVLGRLRRKIDPEGERKPIETLRGRGYRFSTGQQ